MAYGGIVLRQPSHTQSVGATAMLLPCGSCLGCRMDNRRDWVIRCQLEQKQHAESCWATLTYSEKYLPPTLEKSHLSAFLKRVRAKLDHAERPPLRFFGCGEYGEKNKRPHYHVILFGTADSDLITSCWKRGIIRVDPLTPAAIAYVAGYTNKKLDHRRRSRGEQVDPETGELFVHQEPFLLMSRRPGIASAARDTFRQSWRDIAIHNGKPTPVPRYLHEGWKKTQSAEALDEYQTKKREKTFARKNEEAIRAGNPHFFQFERLSAAAEIAIAKHHQQAERRKL